VQHVEEIVLVRPPSGEVLRQRDVALAVDQRMEHVRQKSHCWRKIWVGIWDKHTEFEDTRSIVPLVDKDNPVEDYQKLGLKRKRRKKVMVILPFRLSDEGMT
jgi:hypothetical protein